MPRPPATAELDYKGKQAPAAPMETGDLDYMALMRNRYEDAKAGWSVIREDFREDLRYVSGDPGDQWDPGIKSSRDDDGVPALTMDALNPLVNQIVNQSRKDRPQPKVNPGDGGDPAVAEALEGKMRHVMYESHADIAFDTAEMYCASGGFGFYRITKERVGGRTKVLPNGGRVKIGGQYEPRVKRIEDPLTVLFDPDVQEPDYQDARYCFIPKKYDRDEFRRLFKKEPIPFPFEDHIDSDWGDESKVLAAEYWWVEEIQHRVVKLEDGTEDVASEIDFDEDEVLSDYQITERIVHCDIVDGEKALEEGIWEGRWISIIPVVAKQIISQGRRRYVSAIRYSRDPQTLINASMSSTAARLAEINPAPFTGITGTFNNKKWRDGKRHFFMEWTPVYDKNSGQLLNPNGPQRNAFEPAIQGSTEAAAQAVDALKRAVGYVDSVTQPSQNDLSGVAITKRDQQANLANVQYEDSLTDSMWHCGRVIVDLLMSLTDTPRVWDTRTESGDTSKVPVTMDVPEGTQPAAPGYEGQPHLKIDDGDYGVTISEGPSYNTKNEEGTDFLIRVIEANPAMQAIYLPAIFERMGFSDLAEIATAAQPPQLQQALAAARGQGPSPAMVQQQAAGLQAQNAQLKAVLQKVMTALQTKQVETEGKLAVQNAKTQGDLATEKLKTIRAMIETQMDHTHDATKELTGHHMNAIEHITNMLHASELPVQSAALAPEPEPQGATA